MNTSIILATDSYKLNHWNQYPRDAEAVYSYFESRPGAQFPYTVFFGLQSLLKRYLVGSVVSWDDISQANQLSLEHFGSNDYFNYHGWSHIIQKHGGRLPLRIRAVPEGTAVPTGNVLMTVENTDPKCFWLTNAIESLLTHVWYPSTVATLSHHTINQRIAPVLGRTAETMDALPFMLHDFGYRGASSHESAAIGGLAHLVNSMGTDTLPALLLAQEHYGAQEAVGVSVAATEHSVMTSLGETGEFNVVDRLLEEYPGGILSVVADSYDIYRFVKRLGSLYRASLLQRDGVFVVRPDSVTPDHPLPHQLVVWILEQLWRDFGGHMNANGYRVLDSHVRVLWGDGIDPRGIQDILIAAQNFGFSAENLVFGMGGGLLQKVNRDTQRFAFKASAIKRNGTWHDVSKQPLDASKTSKKGRLQLSRFTDVDGEPSFHTLAEGERIGMTADLRVGKYGDDRRTAKADILETVFEDGQLTTEYTFDEVRAHAKASVPVLA